MTFPELTITPIDIFFTAVLLIATIRCVFRGFVKEILSVAALVGGIGLALLFNGALGLYLTENFGIEKWSRVIAFLGIFVIVYLIIKIFEGLIQRIIEKLHIERLDRALGFFLGILEGVIFVAVIIVIMQIQPFVSVEEVLSGSIIAGLIIRYLPYGIEFIRSQA